MDSDSYGHFPLSCQVYNLISPQWQRCSARQKMFKITRGGLPKPRTAGICVQNKPECEKQKKRRGRARATEPKGLRNKIQPSIPDQDFIATKLPSEGVSSNQQRDRSSLAVAFRADGAAEPLRLIFSLRQTRSGCLWATSAAGI